MNKVQVAIYDMVRMCNCAACGCDLLGSGQQVIIEFLDKSVRASLPPRVGGRILGRPYCPSCLAPRSRGGGGSRVGRLPPEPSPGQENAIRQREDV